MVPATRRFVELPLRLIHLRPNLLAQRIDRDEIAFALDMPEFPAIAGRRALHFGRDLMDRALGVGGNHRAVGPDLRRPATARIDQNLARLQEAALDQRTERD